MGVTAAATTLRPIRRTAEDRRSRYRVGEPGAGCTDGNLVSWIAPSAGGGSFYGYRGRGHTDEFWILEVEGTLVVIEANWSPGSSEAGLAELRAILDSIRVEP